MKAITLTLSLLALLGSAASGFFYIQIGNTKEALQNQLSAEQTKAAGLKSDLDKTTEEREGLQTRLTATDGELGDTKSKLTASEARAVQSARESTQLKSIVAKAEADTQKLNTDLASLRSELVKARLEAEVANPAELEKYKQTVATLEAQLASLNGTSASASTSVGTTTAGTPAGPALGVRTSSARVAAVGPKSAFVVLELGTADGVNAGQKFLIARDGKVIADAIVSDVKDAYAVAQVNPATTKGFLAAGDVASLQK
jgi:septal ring factor EnvC (AmiA/AmiB activator)